MLLNWEFRILTPPDTATLYARNNDLTSVYNAIPKISACLTYNNISRDVILRNQDDWNSVAYNDSDQFIW